MPLKIDIFYRKEKKAYIVFPPGKEKEMTEFDMYKQNPNVPISSLPISLIQMFKTEGWTTERVDLKYH